MKDITCRLLVIGAGPGGYVAAIRAGQLGIDTVIVDRGRPGGTCLNIGCIPSKALIHAAGEFRKAATHNAGPLGITLGEPRIDLALTVAWKDRIVGRLTTGVTGLIKKAGVKWIHGAARFRDGKTVVVETETGAQLIRAEEIVIATGSAPVELPSLPFGGAIISSTQALSLKQVPASLAVAPSGSGPESSPTAPSGRLASTPPSPAAPPSSSPQPTEPTRSAARESTRRFRMSFLG